MYVEKQKKQKRKKIESANKYHTIINTKKLRLDVVLPPPPAPCAQCDTEKVSWPKRTYTHTISTRGKFHFECIVEFWHTIMLTPSVRTSASGPASIKWKKYERLLFSFGFVVFSLDFFSAIVRRCHDKWFFLLCDGAQQKNCSPSC